MPDVEVLMVPHLQFLPLMLNSNKFVLCLDPPLDNVCSALPILSVLDLELTVNLMEPVEIVHLLVTLDVLLLMVHQTLHKDKQFAIQTLEFVSLLVLPTLMLLIPHPAPTFMEFHPVQPFSSIVKQTEHVSLVVTQLELAVVLLMVLLQETHHKLNVTPKVCVLHHSDVE
jgi:hypothetical protein